jgi:cysteinyl-tRNA synthetase
MPTRFYNTLLHQEAAFVPLEKGPDPNHPLRGAVLRMYTCGPTVYDYAHIGNFRAFLFADLLRRYLEFRGATVRQVMNMTDVGHMTDDAAADAGGEDKMAVAARRLRESKKAGAALVDNPDDPYQVAGYFIQAFLDDARALRLAVVAEYDAAPPDRREQIMPRPTQQIPAFLALTQRLLETGHAYVGDDGVVYYSVHSFPQYGKLSGNSLEQLSHGAGGRVNERATKRHPADFFLWKPDPSHIMRWPSPWGEGYPGWHIECSAMAMSILGPMLDIHTGGEDNIFPHHECEIAQSEGATGKSFAQFWMHTRHLMVNGEKMSKSKGNFFTIRDLIAKGYDPLAIRFALLGTRYREPMNFTLQSLHEAAGNVTTLRDLADKLVTAAGEVNASGVVLQPSDRQLLEDFAKAMDDDLNISAALGAVFTWAAPLGKQKKLQPAQAQSALEALRRVDHVLGVVFAPLRTLDPEKTAKVETLMNRRAEARANKDWPASDDLRKQLTDLGVEVKDTPTGSTWRPRLAPATA